MELHHTLFEHLHGHLCALPKLTPCTIHDYMQHGIMRDLWTQERETTRNRQEPRYLLSVMSMQCIPSASCWGGHQSACRKPLCMESAEGQQSRMQKSAS